MLNIIPFKQANSEIFIVAKINQEIITNVDLNFEKRHSAGNKVTRTISSIEIGTRKINLIINKGPIMQSVSTKISILICLSRRSGVLSCMTSYPRIKLSIPRNMHMPLLNPTGNEHK